MTGPRIALTLDAEFGDRPSRPESFERIVAALAERQVRATFFVQGRWLESRPGSARRLADDGHLVGNHSHYHVRLPLLTDDGLGEDVTCADALLRDELGAEARPWFRCPFGAGATETRVLAGLAARGYRHVGWHVDPLDWDPARTPAEVAAAVVDGALAGGDGTVVLLHAWPDSTAQALPRILDRLAAAGAQLVTLAELPAELLEAVPAAGPETP